MNNYKNTDYTRDELITLALKMAMRQARKWQDNAINEYDIDAAEHYENLANAYRAIIEENHAQQPAEAPTTAPAAEAEQQTTETAEAAQAAPAARQTDDITAAMVDAIGADAPAQTVTVTWANGTRAAYSASMLDLLKTDPAAIDIQDDDTGELIYIKPDPDDAPAAQAEADPTETT